MKVWQVAGDAADAGQERAYKQLTECRWQAVCEHCDAVYELVDFDPARAASYVSSERCQRCRRTLDCGPPMACLPARRLETPYLSQCPACEVWGCTECDLTKLRMR